MAYFHCLIGGGSSGGGYELTVTCDAAFAGTTITCTDGVTTLTSTCPSASPYEVEFEIPNGGDWTISGVVSGQTVTTGVSIPTTAELIAFVHKTITIYSATEDTISYTDIYGDTQTEVFASGQSSKQITVDIEPNGSSITFTSGVAKDPSDLTAYYSKTVTIDSNTTDVYIMPDNALYWWGYESSNFEDCTSANGWSLSGYVLDTPTFNTFDITLSARSWDTAGHRSAVASKTQVSASKLLSVAQGIIELSGYGYGSIRTATSKSFDNQNDNSQLISSTNMIKVENSFTQGNYYLFAACDGGGSGQSSKIYALWYE